MGAVRIPGYHRLAASLGSLGATIFAGLLPLLPASALHGAEFRGGERVVVAAGEVVEDDLYATGDRVLIEGTVVGDLVASGREIRIRGEVTGDLLAAGQVVVVDGRIGDDVRIAGLGLFLRKGAAVLGDLFAAGFAFDSAPGSRIGGGAYVRSQVARFGGAVDGELVAGGGNVEIDGAVGGPVRLEMAAGSDQAPWLAMIPTPEPLPTVPSGLRLGPGARLAGGLVYTSADEASVDPGAVIAGSIERREPQIDEGGEASEAGWQTALRRFFGLVLVALLLVGLGSNRIVDWTCQIERRPGTVLLLGLVALPVLLAGSLLTFVLTLFLGIAAGSAGLASLAFALIGGGLLSLLGGAFLAWLGAILIGPVVAASWLGGRVLAAAGRLPRAWLNALLGIALLSLVAGVPWLGTLSAVVAAIAGLGAVVAGWRGEAPATARS